ncbi:hypothetical protein SERLADRAFT_405904 [Serpula lacrymans var. lacrymans S7.9]|uniref:Uncharacterized protein n=1 Tax=Serpula lacrymans var. lacrymans (strain S7.9) TaxID=578457 RepID=F8NK03_SERL9|nr:uncharacterized protein SERLADRAFT_405904 [Serpula lacrymans var. lacrymans S7.9]EGO28315.1 hypothetical protein SERLADRAFT_405904 [Serpula lacrymans var. lacrymans S7.9]
MDIHGRIVLWYLLGILTEEKQQSMCDSLQHLKQDMESKCPKKPSKNWRKSSEYDKNPGDCLFLAWFQLSHKKTGEAPQDSPSLHKSTPPGTGELWLQSFVETGALMCATLRVAHPALYEQAQEALVRVEDHMDDVTVPKAWSSVFNVLSIISNWETPVHWDCLFKAVWYDMLASVGDHNDAILELTRQGRFCFKFDSGIIAAFSGKLLSHGVSSYSVRGGDPGMMWNSS